MKHRILLVDDDIENLGINKKLLQAHDYEIYTAQNGADAIATVEAARKDFSLIMMDYHMPGLNGAETVRKIKAVRHNQQILAFSLDDTREAMRENFKAGVLDFLDKNSDNDHLLNTIANYCAKYDELFKTLDKSDLLKDEKVKLINEVGLIGISDSLHNLAKSILRIAPTNATTLIFGESGTGKELVAKALHQKSQRAKGPFIAFNVAAEPQSLLDSSLFGHKKGAFTGAMNEQLGKFRLAHGGTIFLDEIGDLSLDLQIKLLRVIQEKEITPLGAIRSQSVDVRIIAATHKDLEKMVEEGKFREDLYFRLKNIIISTTPLRDRPEDIEPLVAHFTEQICKENGFVKNFQRRCLDTLKKHSWKGNVRELRSVVESHLIKSEANTIRPEDLDSSLFEPGIRANPKTLEEIDDYLETQKREYITGVIKKSVSLAGASKELGISKQSLNYFIDKWNL